MRKGNGLDGFVVQREAFRQNNAPTVLVGMLSPYACRRAQRRIRNSTTLAVAPSPCYALVLNSLRNGAVDLTLRRSTVTCSLRCAHACTRLHTLARACTRLHTRSVSSTVWRANTRLGRRRMHNSGMRVSSIRQRTTHDSYPYVPLRMLCRIPPPFHPLQPLSPCLAQSLFRPCHLVRMHFVDFLAVFQRRHQRRICCAART